MLTVVPTPMAYWPLNSTEQLGDISGNGYSFEVLAGTSQFEQDSLTGQEYLLMDDTFSARVTLNGGVR